MKFEMQDGSTYEGKTYEDVVRAMSSDKLTTPRSIRSYRKATANRVHQVYGLTIDPETNTSFVEGLVSSGLMRKIS